MNEQDIENIEKTVLDNQEAIDKLERRLEFDNTLLEHFIQEQQREEENLLAYQNEHLKKRREKAAKEQAQRRIAELEAQLAARDQGLYTRGQLLNGILGDSVEATVTIQRGNDPRVYRSSIRRRDNDRAEYVSSDEMMPTIEEAKEQETPERLRVFQPIAELHYDSKDEEDAKMPAIQYEEQLGTSEMNAPRIEYSVSSDISSISHSTIDSVEDPCILAAANSMIKTGRPTELICELTGYTKEKVESLRRQIPSQSEEALRVVEQSFSELDRATMPKDDAITLSDIDSSILLDISLESKELDDQESAARKPWSSYINGWRKK